MIHNLYSFHGSDHKVGTTMLAQSVAETISSGYPGLKLLLIAMNGRESTEYIRDTPAAIDSVKFHMDNRTMTGEDFLKTCTHKGNLYLMGGIVNEREARFYHPETAKYFLEEAAPEFDLVIADCGNDLDNGLTAGTLPLSAGVFLVTAQQESALGRYEKNKRLFEDLGVEISRHIINKYCQQDPCDLSYITGRLELEKEKLMKVAMAGSARQAELDRRTLLEYKNEAFAQDVTAVANEILRKCGLGEIRGKRKRPWKSFI